MQKILRKRILRNLKSNWVRQLALMLIIILSMFLVISIVAAADTVTEGAAEYATDCLAEDGEFTTFYPLEDERIQDIKDEGVTIEEHFYNDFVLDDSSTIRIFKNRELIDLVSIIYGKFAENDTEIVLEKRYCETHQISVGDKIEIAGITYEVAGIGVCPDYEGAFKNIGDACVDSDAFGLGFVTEDNYEELAESGECDKAETYLYSYLLNGKISDDELKDEVADYTELFITRENNPRMGCAADDQKANKSSGLLAGIIVLILVAYVISVFVTHEIDEDSSVIGTLYALGIRRGEIMRHYLILPVIVTFISGIIGMLLGFSNGMITSQMGSALNYFSLPTLEIIHPSYLCIYSVVLPPVISVIVNIIVISRKLRRTALSLMRNEGSKSKISKLKLKGNSFTHKFFIRQLVREFRSSMTMVLSMCIALLLLMLGLDIYAMCAHIRDDNKNDVKFEYMYTYKIPEGEVPDGGYEAYSKSFTIENLGYEMDVTMMGITEKNPFFDLTLSENSSEVVITSAMAQKFALRVGDSFEIVDEDNDDEPYTFTVSEVLQYSPSFYMFMDIDSMRELFEANDDYFNVVFSDSKLDIDPNVIFATTSKHDISNAADIYISLMWSMIYTLVGVAVVVFAIVMYLMMKMMLDRSAQSISLVQIFGYRTKEIRKLYLDGNLVIVAIGALIAIPLTKKIIDSIYPFTVADAASAMDLSLAWYFYPFIYLAIILLYLIINRILVFRIKQITPAEILKNRE